MNTVAPIKLHPLPHGGWIMADAISHGIGKTHTNTLRHLVDVNSVSTEKKDIPDSLFDIQFAPGAHVEDATGGKP